MVLVVRQDLAMGKGKIAAQCSHATLGASAELCTAAQGALGKPCFIPVVHDSWLTWKKTAKYRKPCIYCAP